MNPPGWWIAGLDQPAAAGLRVTISSGSGHTVDVLKVQEARQGANARWAWRCTCGAWSQLVWGLKNTAIGSAQAHINRNHKETSMTTLDNLIRRRAELEAQIAQLAALPPEPLTDDEANVIWFEKSFGTEQTYPYAAVRAGDGRWYITGRVPKVYNWQELIEWIGPDAQVWFATEWEQL